MSTDKLPSVWGFRDFPVLKAVAACFDEGRSPNHQHLMEATGLPSTDVARALDALERRGLVSLERTMAGEGLVLDVAGEAYVLTGLHPDGGEAIDALVAMLRQAAEHSTSAEEKSRLKKAASALADLTGQVGAGVVTAFLAHQGGFS